MSLGARIQATFDRFATGLCVEFRGRSHTWADVRGFSGELDALLDASDCRGGGRVAVIARSSPGALGALYSLLATGRSIVNVNPFQHASAIAAEIEAIRPAAVVAADSDWQSAELTGAVRASGAAGVRIENDDLGEPGLAIAGDSTRRVVPDGIGTAAIEMLTSGTTGAPRRMPMRAQTVEAAGLDFIDNLAEIEAHFGCAGRMTPFLMFWPLTNIGGLSFVFHAALEGRPMVLFERFVVADWLEAVKRYRPAVLTLPPAHLRMVMSAGLAREDLAGASLVRSANAPLDPHLREEFEDAYGIPVMTYYGATEFCGVITGWPMSTFLQLRKNRPGSVGLPRPGVRVRIADRDSGEPVGPNEPGTVQVCVARIGPEWMTTSDTGHLDEEGFLFLDGRSDGAINRGGFKVLPEAIASVLRSHPAVFDAAVIGVPDARLGAKPVAFVELRPGAANPGANELQRYAQERLVAWQVPEQIVILDRLPRTPNLKISTGELERIARERSA